MNDNHQVTRLVKLNPYFRKDNPKKLMGMAIVAITGNRDNLGGYPTQELTSLIPFFAFF